jgi:thiamine biosynthesis lipoprotein
MSNKSTIFLFILILISSSGFIHLINGHPQQSLFIITGQAQGTTYTIKYINTSAIIEKHSIDNLFSEIDQSLSLYQSTSLITQFNQDNRGVKADFHLLNVVRASLLISAATHGCFDITSKPFSMLWGFNAATPKSIPSKDLLQKTSQAVGHDHLSIIMDSLVKDNPHTKIDCDGIAQGYTVDQLSSLLRNKGIKDFMVELGGEVFTSGKNLSGNDWVVGIEVSDVYATDDHFITKKISLSNVAVTTSGSMKKFRRLGNRYWSHIIDPRTGLPVDNGIVSVTVIGKDAITADAYDNGFMVMGIQSSLLLANQSKDLGVYIVYVKADGSIADTANAYFNGFLIHE